VIKYVFYKLTDEKKGRGVKSKKS